MNCCRKQSWSPLSFRKEPWALGVVGWAGVRMGSEGSLRTLAGNCFPCFRMQPLLVDVLPGLLDALFSVFMGLDFLQNAASFSHLLFFFFFPQLCT